ncbi:MAG TPA: choice-of-anchor tandem repeat GloVer-containing protein, partial [Candidatus Tumulicola sp.]
DGQFPQAGLTAVKGVLYGTTPNGGDNANGTVFTSTKSGAVDIAYSFASLPDGTNPAASLTSAGGVLYGTTLGGGGTSCNSGQGCGTVYTIDASGKETVLYRFQGGSDGQTPSSKLLYFRGMLYGTTFSGGGSGCNFRGCGTVFAIDPSGSERVVYAFKGGNDGANPDAGVIASNGKLYGTTSSGGGNANDGTVFSLDRSGKERAIHRFKGTPDGSDPEADLVAVKGVLYGTTFGGGQNDFGTVFTMTRSGSETVLHDFTFGSDGGNPSAALVPFKSKLYGTAKTGGPAGFGTVYSIDL